MKNEKRKTGEHHDNVMKLYIYTTSGIRVYVFEGIGREYFYVEPDCINYYIIVESESWFYFIYLNIYIYANCE